MSGPWVYLFNANYQKIIMKDSSLKREINQNLVVLKENKEEVWGGFYDLIATALFLTLKVSKWNKGKKGRKMERHREQLGEFH